jgi:hypothetical protein
MTIFSCLPQLTGGNAILMDFFSFLLCSEIWVVLILANVVRVCSSKGLDPMVRNQVFFTFDQGSNPMRDFAAP